MTQRFGKQPKYLGNGLDTWDTPFIFEKRLYYVGKGLRNGLNMWEMTYIFGKWLMFLRNG